jgi:hypothetical protein
VVEVSGYSIVNFAEIFAVFLDIVICSQAETIIPASQALFEITAVSSDNNFIIQEPTCC